MFRFRRKFRNRKNTDQKLPELCSDAEEQSLSVTHLTGAADLVCRVIFLAERNLVVAASLDNSVRVYDINTSGEPCAIFQHHNDRVHDVVQLESDLVASVGDDKRLFTWRASTTEIIGEWDHDSQLSAVEKLGESKIIVGDENGNVMVLTHQSASSFQVHRRLPNSHSGWVSDITVYSNLIVTCSIDETAEVWDINSLTLRATLHHRNSVNHYLGGETIWPTNNIVYSAAVSDRFIVTTCSDGKMRVFQNGYKFNLLFDLTIDDDHILRHVSFLNDDIVVAAVSQSLCVISLPTKAVLSRVPVDDYVDSFSVLDDGRIAVAGGAFDKIGYCAIVTPPQSMREPVEDLFISLYPLSAFARARAPLRAARIGVQKHQLTRAEACKTAITSENCARSLDEWGIAHSLLMEAVKRGEIPASRHLGDSIAHWYQVLYQHCAKLAMSKKCIGSIKLLFKEAEDAGVIAEGQIESLISSIGVRQDMDADNRFLVHAAYQLFMRQAEADVRLREVLHYQRVQQVAAVFNALIGCIPVGGAILTNMMTGGAAILNDLQVCGLVESVLGIGNDVSGGFGSDSLVDRVLRRSNTVLCVEEWENVPFEKRKVVEDAACNLGLGIDELREKLQIVAAMQVEEDGKPSEQVVIEEVNEDTTIQPVTPSAVVSEGNASLIAEVACVDGVGAFAPAVTTTGSANEEESELKRWEEMGVTKDVVAPLKGGEAAACFTAFILNYDRHSETDFQKLTKKMEEVFRKKRIYGASFVEADEEERKELVEVLMTALAGVTDKDAVKLTKMWVKKFIRLAIQ